MSYSRPHRRFSTRPSHSPLDLPLEIYLWIGKYVSWSDLKACVRVSKLWNEVFSPFLFEALDIQGSERAAQWRVFDPLGMLHKVSLAPKNAPYYHRLPTENLVRYGSHVRYLAIQQNSDIKKAGFSTVTFLKNLCIVGEDKSEDRLRTRKWDSLRQSSKALLVFNQGIQFLDLQYLELTKTLSWVAQECPNLERLRLAYTTFDQLDLAMVFKSCRSLTFLSQISNRIKGSNKGSEQSRDVSSISDLRELELWNCSEKNNAIALTELFQCCPRLKSVLIGGRSYGMSYAELQFHCCPELSKVALLIFPNNMRVISKFQDMFPPTVSDIAFEDCPIDETIESLRPRFIYLTSIRFSESRPHLYSMDTMDHEVISEIIRSCPNLVHMECPAIYGILIYPHELNEGSTVNQQIKSPLWGSFPLKLKTLKVGTLKLFSTIENSKSRSIVPLAALRSLETFSFVRIETKYAYESSEELEKCTGEYYDYDCEEQLGRSELKKVEGLSWVLRTWPNLTHYAFDRE